MAGFAPITGPAPKVLILGSMPSRISLSEEQYYANPRNAFWWIMSELFEFDLKLDYQARSSALAHAAVAVWDVLSDCERPGSLDSAIVKSSEVSNDFRSWFICYPSIVRVVFNGAAAQGLFRRHQKQLINDINQTRPGFEWHRCPSTSPAHASITKHDKLKLWRNSVI